LDNGPV